MLNNDFLHYFNFNWIDILNNNFNWIDMRPLSYIDMLTCIYTIKVTHDFAHVDQIDVQLRHGLKHLEMEFSMKLKLDRWNSNR